MSKTILQIANEIGVSKQAIQKRLTREPLKSSIQAYIKVVDGTKQIDDIGETLIKSAFSENSSIDVHKDTSTDKTDVPIDVHSEIIGLLTSNLEIIQNQLLEKDRQITKLQAELSEERKHGREIADKLAVLANNAQQLHGGTLGQLTADGDSRSDDGAGQTVEASMRSVDEIYKTTEKRGLFGIFSKKGGRKSDS
ncbi:MAG: hypothetical protein FWG51_03670 [Firmicutes bacterium]|nr:hypothetical protein [Bacillota bacterium]